MNDGTSTFPSAMPANASTDSPRNDHWSPTNERAPSPIAMARAPSVIAPFRDSRTARETAVAPNTAKQMPGRAVRTPAATPLMPSDSRSSARTGPIEVAPGRRLMASRSTAAIAT